MKNYTVVISILVLCVLFLVGSNCCTCGERKISRKKIPSAVLTAFQQSYPNATIKGQAVETEKGRKYFEIESVDGKTNRDLLYTPEGKVYEIEESVEPGTLPDAIKGTLEKEYPKGKIVYAEKVTHDTAVTYEVRMKLGKKSKGVSLDPTGTILKPDNEGEEKEENEKGEEKEDN